MNHESTCALNRDGATGPCTCAAKERPIWISEYYSQPVSIGSITMMPHEWLALALRARTGNDASLNIERLN